MRVGVEEGGNNQSTGMESFQAAESTIVSTRVWLNAEQADLCRNLHQVSPSTCFASSQMLLRYCQQSRGHQFELVLQGRGRV